MADIQKLRARFEAVRAEKRKVTGLWDEIERFIMPATGKADEPAGESGAKLKTDVEVWDITAPLALEHLAASLHGSVTSPAARWLDFEWQDVDLENDTDAVKYREKLAEAVWREIQASDFNAEIAGAYQEFGGIGNMLLTVEVADEQTWKGLDFTGVPCREGDFEEDSRGRIHTFFRHLKWTPVQIIDRIGLDAAPERIRELAKGANGGVDPIDVVFCIFRREEVPLTEEFPLAADKRPFGCVYFTLDQGEQLGEESGYYEMPAVIGRWARRSGSKWGFGRGNIALRGVKWLNAFKESSREAAAMAARPPHVGTERGVLSDPDVGPDGFTVVSGLDQLQTLDTGARFDVSAEVLRDERAEIRRAFHEDDLQLKESPQMTAYEAAQRRELMDRVLGSPVGRFSTDVLVEVVMLSMRHMSRAKKLPEAPAIVKQRKAELSVRFRGPIARAQLMDEVAAIERTAAFIATLMKMGFTGARHYLNLAQTIKEHQKRIGSPAAMLNSEVQAKKAAEDEAAMMARVQAAEASKKEGEAARAQAQAQAIAPRPPVAGGPGFAIDTQPALTPSGGIVS